MRIVRLITLRKHANILLRNAIGIKMLRNVKILIAISMVVQQVYNYSKKMKQEFTYSV